jgi:Photosynthesis system II assembly factor YCF48
MEQLPKIAQQRLQATAKAGVHPDPDLLTAFAEKSLNECERNQVLQHLGECTDCRSVLALAMPEAKFGPAASPQRSPWLAWPMLRWGALAACVVIVSTAITLRHERQQGSEHVVATNAPAVAAPASRPAESQFAGQANEKASANIDSRSGLQSDRDFAATSKSAKQRGDETRLTSKAPVMNGLNEPALNGLKETEELKKNSAVNDSLARAGDSGAIVSTNKPSQSPGEQTSAVMAPAAPPAPNAVTEATKAGMAQSESVPMRKTAQGTDQKTQKAKDESPRNELDANARAVGGILSGDQKTDKAAAESGFGTYDGPRRTKTLSAKSMAASRWTVSVNGEVQRSIDSGKTWQTIPVANNVKFHALAANDADIWVGGSAGGLYHSTDDGRHWTQITPSVDGKPLTADIIGLEFIDAQHGSLTTDAHDIWTTSDGGGTWQTK